MRIALHRFHALFLGVLLLASFVRADDIGSAIEKKYGLDTDFAANYRVEMIGQRVAQAAGLTDIHFIIFNDKELNAMAVPDGRIFVTSLMAHAVADDELAFVLGHEMTHIQEKHSNNQMTRATGGALLGAILVAAIGGNERDIRLGADIAGGLTLGHYSRRDENRADVGGLRLMSRCGYDPKQAALAMQRLIDKYGAGDAKTPVLGWFATHPDSRDRKKRLEKGAAQLTKTPLSRLDPPQGVELTLDSSARHASAWAYNYLSLALTSSSGGRAVALPPLVGLASPSAQPAKVSRSRMRLPALAFANKAAQTNAANKGNAKADEPLPAVTVTVPNVPVAYRLILSLRQTPPAHASPAEKGEGTAVEATLHWTAVNSGLSGICTATSQTRKDVPWQANEQVKDPAALSRLADGKEDNVEGTLEADALRRVTRAFAEVVRTGGPVDHSAPVSVRLSDNKARPGDYIAVVRDNKFVAEVRIDQIKGRDVTGSVLWGVHTWKKGDHFAVMEYDR